MPTLVASDLHLGTMAGVDVLRHEHVRERFAAALDGIDRVVLLGDVLELRQLPIGRVLESSYPFFEMLGETLGEGGRVVIVPGNHDHHLALPLLERGRLTSDPPPLGLEEEMRPRGSGPLAAIARRMPGVELTLAYPGVRVRKDVFATHGHYLDCHITIPRLEVLAIAAVRRMLGGVPEGRATPSDYEQIAAPVYALAYGLAQAASPERSIAGTNASAKVWAALNGRARGRRAAIRARALSHVAIPLVVAGLNRAGLGPLSANLSGHALYRAGIGAMGEVVARLGIEAEHVLFGHTHRTGPLAADDDWTAPGGIRLMNTGSWLYEPALVSSASSESPYWPGACVVVEDSGPPRLERLLGGVPHGELAAERERPSGAERPGDAAGRLGGERAQQ